MKTKIINISLPDSLLSDADNLAQKEYRTRSELFREALRIYILTRKNLNGWPTRLYTEKEIQDFLKEDQS